jgi:gliding motility-associated-like protein
MREMKFLIVSVFLHLIVSNFLIGQDLRYTYGFNACNGEEENILIPGVTFSGNPSCACGPDGMAYRLDGIDDMFSLPLILNASFSNDFTFDFYFANPDPVGESQIMYAGNCNGIDSLMRFRHFADSDEYLFEFSGAINNYYSTKFQVDPKQCWHRLTLVKFKLEFFLYVDNQLVSKFLAKETIFLSKNNNIIFGENPCTGASGGNFKGSIDQVSFTNRPLSSQEILALDLQIGRITTSSQTIFAGDSVSLEVGQYCGNLSWSPSTTLSSGTSSPTIAKPDVTTTYWANVNDGVCPARDSVIIYVADPDKLDCSKLLLPSAFTPNGDGRNDLYGISNKFIVDDLLFFEIYARNGAKVWETTSINDAWDGGMNGVRQSGASYLYKIKYTCGGETYLAVDNFVAIR